jgi:transcriptional regulator with XRE-family HTH domain
MLGPMGDPDMAPTLGEIIRRQRELGAMSMRQFAEMVGISNPYLSQIERGLREPSDKVVEAIARNLDVSAEVLYRQAGLDPDAEEEDEPEVRLAIRADPRLTARQRQALIEVYDAFVGAGRPVRRRRRRPEDGDGAEEAEG